MKRSALRIFRSVATIYVVLCVFMYFFQRSILYHPRHVLPSPTGTCMTLDVPGATLQVCVRERSGPAALIYFGGNAEDVSFSLNEFAAAFKQHTIYMLHYRGYGGSTGSPSEVALHADAQVLFDHVRATHPDVTLVGRSLGSGVAVRLAANNPVRELVLVASYDSILNLAKQRFWFMPVGLLLQDRFESWRDAPLVKAPTRIIAAEHDEVIPLTSTSALLKAFTPGIASMQVIPRTSHNTISNSAEYMRLVQGRE